MCHEMVKSSSSGDVSVQKLNRMGQYTDTIRLERVVPKERLPNKHKKINKGTVLIAQNNW